jgi:hypothetical protein
MSLPFKPRKQTADKAFKLNQSLIEIPFCLVKSRNGFSNPDFSASVNFLNVIAE